MASCDMMYLYGNFVTVRDIRDDYLTGTHLRKYIVARGATVLQSFGSLCIEWEPEMPAVITLRWSTMSVDVVFHLNSPSLHPRPSRSGLLLNATMTQQFRPSSILSTRALSATTVKGHCGSSRPGAWGRWRIQECGTTQFRHRSNVDRATTHMLLANNSRSHRRGKALSSNYVIDILLFSNINNWHLIVLEVGSTNHCPKDAWAAGLLQLHKGILQRSRPHQSLIVVISIVHTYTHLSLLLSSQSILILIIPHTCLLPPKPTLDLAVFHLT